MDAHESDSDAEMNAFQALDALAIAAKREAKSLAKGVEAKHRPALVRKSGKGQYGFGDPQKWVQCASCQKWRKVPYTLGDDDLKDDWTCQDNIWDSEHASCDVPQALSNDEIDKILALQAEGMEPVDEQDAAEEEFEDAEGGDYEDEEEVEEEEGEGDDPDSRDGANEEDVDEGDDGGAPVSKKDRMKRYLRLYTPTKRTPIPDPLSLEESPSNKQRNKGRAIRRSVKSPPPSGGKLKGMGRTPVRAITTPTRGTPGSRGSNGKGRRGGSLHRVRGARGGSGRMGRVVNEAAAALIGLGMDIDDMEGDDVTCPDLRANLGYPKETLRPGRVVWAKVEGHDWWPARTVRRRAVPREVGAPPGGPDQAMNYVPVVFFTAKGLPREVEERGDSVEGVFASRLKCEEGDREEAEYAWLAYDCLKPFHLEDVTGSEGGVASGDATLQASVSAAHAAIRSGRVRVGRSSPESGAVGQEVDESDSDGGWGLSAQSYASGRLSRSRGRGGRGRRGRGGRGRRGRGRRGLVRGGGDDDDGGASDSDGALDLAQDGCACAKPAVDQILGWRYPPTEKEKAVERERQRIWYSERPNRIEKIKIRVASGTMSEGPSTEDMLAAAVAVKNELEDPFCQDEADAAAALLDFGCEDASLAGGARGSPEDPTDQEGGIGTEVEYYVRWCNKAHIHNQWVLESELMGLAKRKLLNFKKVYGDKPCNLMKDIWCVPEKLVARRPCPSGPGWECLVKWMDLGYEQCTWEQEGEGLLAQPECAALHADLCRRQQHAVARASAQAQSEAKQLVEEGKSLLDGSMVSQPSWVCGPSLYPHQLEGMDWLKRQWLEGRHSILADDNGLGKTATTVVFLKSLLQDFKICNPILVVAPVSSLNFWAGEWSFWVGQDVSVVQYAGGVSARTLIYDHELWLSAGSLDDRHTQAKRLASRVVKPDVVLTTFEVLTSDSPLLECIKWEAVVVDLRLRSKRVLTKLGALIPKSMEAHRVLMMTNALESSKEELLAVASFVKPKEDDIIKVVGEEVYADDSQAIPVLQQLLAPHCCRHSSADVIQKERPTISQEVVVPVECSEMQLECYRTTLARYYEFLTDTKAARNRSANLRLIVGELRKVCHHPYLLPEFEPEPGEEDPEGFKRIAASGRLQVLDSILVELRARKQRVLIVSHSSRHLEVVAAYAMQKFGEGAVELANANMPSATRHAAVQAFKSDKSADEKFLLLMGIKMCGLGTDLPQVDVVVILDSDWLPKSDIQSVRHALCIGRPGSLLVLRLYMRGTVEERVLQLVERKRGFEAILRPGQTRGSSSSARQLEELLMWGAAKIFKKSGAADTLLEGGGASGEAGKGLLAEDKSLSPKVAFNQEAAGKVLDYGFAACSTAHEGGPAGADRGVSPSRDGSTHCAVRHWGELDKTEEDDQDGDDEEEEAAGAEGGMVTGDVEEEAVEEGGGTPSLRRSDSTAAAAMLWSQLLKEKWDQLQEEEEEEGGPGPIKPEFAKDEMEDEPIDAVVAGQEAPAESDEATDTEDAAPAGERDLQHQFSSQRSGNLSVGAPDSSLAEGDATTGRGGRGGRGRAKNGGRGMAGRGALASPVGAGRGNRRKKPEGEEEGLVVNALVSMGSDDLSANPAMNGGNRSAKRRKKATPTSAPHLPLELDSENIVAVHQRNQLLREYARHEQVKNAIMDQTSVEGGIALRAYRRIEEIIGELKVPNRAELVQMACQAAEILLMMRQEDDIPSDFQDYTLVAIVAVAAHLMRTEIGDTYGLKFLADKYGHDETALDQVFWHILTRLSYYREVHLQVQQLVAQGFLENGIMSAGTPGWRGPEGAPSLEEPQKLKTEVAVDKRVLDAGASTTSASLPAASNTPGNPPTEVDSFGNQLAAILSADLTKVVQAQDNMDNLPLGPLGTLMPLLQVAGVLHESGIKTALKQIREAQEHIYLLDRCHTMKVQQIQREYQDFMEKIRSKAQGAIDSANRDYQGKKVMLSTRMNVLVDQLQQYIALPTLHSPRPGGQVNSSPLGGLPSSLMAAALSSPVSGAHSISGLKALEQFQDLKSPHHPEGSDPHEVAHRLQEAGVLHTRPGEGNLMGLTTNTLPLGLNQQLQELVQMISCGHISLDQVVEPLRSQLLALLPKELQTPPRGLVGSNRASTAAMAQLSSPPGTKVGIKSSAGTPGSGGGLQLRTPTKGSGNSKNVAPHPLQHGLLSPGIQQAGGKASAAPFYNLPGVSNVAPSVSGPGSTPASPKGFPFPIGTPGLLSPSSSGTSKSGMVNPGLGYALPFKNIPQGPADDGSGRGLPTCTPSQSPNAGSLPTPPTSAPGQTSGPPMPAVAPAGGSAITTVPSPPTSQAVVQENLSTGLPTESTSQGPPVVPVPSRQPPPGIQGQPPRPAAGAPHQGHQPNVPHPVPSSSPATYHMNLQNINEASTPRGTSGAPPNALQTAQSSEVSMPQAPAAPSPRLAFTSPSLPLRVSEGLPHINTSAPPQTSLPLANPSASVATSSMPPAPAISISPVPSQPTAGPPAPIPPRASLYPKMSSGPPLNLASGTVEANAASLPFPIPPSLSALGGKTVTSGPMPALFPRVTTEGPSQHEGPSSGTNAMVEKLRGEPEQKPPASSGGPANSTPLPPHLSPNPVMPVPRGPTPVGPPALLHGLPPLASPGPSVTRRGDALLPPHPGLAPSSLPYSSFPLPHLNNLPLLPGMGVAPNRVNSLNAWLPGSTPEGLSPKGPIWSGPTPAVAVVGNTGTQPSGRGATPEAAPQESTS